MEIVNIPVQMISVCDTDGMLRPIRFRFEDGQHCLQTVSVTEVVNYIETNYIGIKTICVTCLAVSDDEEHMLEMRYSVENHMWQIFRKIY